MVIRLRYNGRVFIPEQPVDIPVDSVLEFDYVPPEPKRDPERARQALRRLASRAVHGLNIPDEAVRRENLYEPPRGL